MLQIPVVLLGEKVLNWFLLELCFKDFFYSMLNLKSGTKLPHLTV